MSRQNYYKRRRVRARRCVEESLIVSLVRRERAIQPFLGVRKLQVVLEDDLAEAGVRIGRDRLFGLLSRHHLLVRRRRRSCRTTDSRHRFRVYGNLLKEMTLTGPGQALVSDITYIGTDEGFMYLSLVMDAYSRAIVGYDCSDSLEVDGALRSLAMALRQIGVGDRPIHHSDRGSQYCCVAYIEMLRRHGVRISMTEANHCYENSRAERLNGILKQEYGLGGCFAGKSHAREAVREAVMLYNCRRPHQSLGYRCPMEVHRAA